MDILVSSNLERLLYHAMEEKSAHVVELMQQFEQEGWFALPEEYRRRISDFLQVG